jgi:hypothetical protein
MADMDNKEIAQNLMAVHGLLAGAVVSERIEESRLHGDAVAFERWQNVQAAIHELRRTRPSTMKQ